MINSNIAKGLHFLETLYADQPDRVIEDQIYFNEEAGIMMVADGAGGETDGHIGSQIMVDLVKKYEDRLINATIEEAQGLFQDIVNTGRDQMVAYILQAYGDQSRVAKEAQKKIGTTFSLGLVKEDSEGQANFVWVNVGDSGFDVQTADGKRIALTKDDTWVQSLVDSNALTQEEAEVHPERGVIADFISNIRKEGKTLEEHQLGIYTLQPGDILVGSSDGVRDNLTGAMQDAIFSQVRNDPKQLMRVLFETAKGVASLYKFQDENGRWRRRLNRDRIGYHLLERVAKWDDISGIAFQPLPVTVSNDAAMLRAGHILNTARGKALVTTLLMTLGMDVNAVLLETAEAFVENSQRYAMARDRKTVLRNSTD